MRDLEACNIPTVHRTGLDVEKCFSEDNLRDRPDSGKLLHATVRNRPANVDVNAYDEQNVNCAIRDNKTVECEVYEEPAKFTERWTPSCVYSKLLNKYRDGLEVAVVELANGNGNDTFVNRLQKYLDVESDTQSSNNATEQYTEPLVIIHKSKSSSSDSQNSESYKEDDLLRSSDSQSESSISLESSDEIMTSLESGVETVIYESASLKEVGSMNPGESETNNDEGKKNKCTIT